MPAPRHAGEEASAGQAEAQPPAAPPFDAGAEGRRPEAGQPPPAFVHCDQARYFVITSNTKENVVKSVRHSLWATQRKNEQRLDEAFRTSPAVILVFSVNRSEAFQGYARMRSPIGKPRSRNADPFNGFGRLFDVEWLRLHDLSYREVDNLRNPLNGDRPVQFSRDGQELTNEVGRRLCGLIDRHIDNPASFPAHHPAPGRAGVPPQLQPPGGTPPGASPSLGAGSGAPPPYGAPPPAAAAQPAARSRGASSGSGSEGEKRHRKRRRMERKLRHPPHPLVANFDEQLEFFLGMDYEEYVEWWRRFGGTAPGPTPPPGVVHGPPPAHHHMGMPPQAMGPQMAPPPGMPPHGHGHMPLPPHLPPHAGPPPPWQPLPPHLAGPPPPLGPPQVPPHLAPPHMLPPHMVPLHMGRA